MLGLHQTQWIMKNTDNANEEFDTLFEIYPIWQEKMLGIRSDYRFVCFLPGSSAEERRRILQPNESLLLYAPELQETIGRHPAQGEPIPFYEEHPLETHHTVDFGMNIINDPDSPLSKVFNYANSEGFIQHFFQLVSIITKTSLKLQYKQLKQQFITSSSIEIIDHDKNAQLKLHTQAFNEKRFLRNKFVTELAKHPQTKDFYRKIRTFFLTNEFLEDDFFKVLLMVGEMLPPLTIIALNYQEN